MSCIWSSTCSIGAPLTIDADKFKTADGDLESSLRLICEKIHAIRLNFNITIEM
jgi:hypothetical protein